MRGIKARAAIACIISILRRCSSKGYGSITASGYDYKKVNLHCQA
jgi:hypothetical protein